jgi:hypothetical protein
MRKFIATAAVTAALGAGLLAAAMPASAATAATPTPADQIGMLIPYNATVAGPFVPYAVSPFSSPAGNVGVNNVPSVGAVPVVITTTDGGCTWTEANSNSAAVTAGQLDGVTYSFTTRRFGIEVSSASAASSPLVFHYNGVPVGCP